MSIRYTLMITKPTFVRTGSRFFFCFLGNLTISSSDLDINQAKSKMSLPKYMQGALPASEYRKAVLSAPSKSLNSLTKPTCGDKTHEVNTKDLRDVKEQVVQSEILHFLSSKGFWCHKVKAVNLVGSGDTLALAVTQKGVPDILACSPLGVFVAIEVKAPRKNAKVSAYQRVTIDHIRDANGHAFVAHSVECVRRYLLASNDLTCQPDWPNY